MKRISLFVAALLLIASFSSLTFANTPPSPATQHVFQNNLQRALTSSNDGVRNSAILVAVQSMTQFPDMNIRSCKKVIERMSREDARSVNRLHAQLAMICFARPELTQIVNPLEYDDSVEFFNHISAVISNRPFTN
ncbi:hypothetical protein JW960_01665 [candidate division KSB1 bacterium]|nr:hypothetical protein [candidate division KSB1 bacterium]